MKRFRKLLFWLHLFSGVTAGAVILIMSVTGVILALKPQIQNWVDRDVRYVTPQPARLGVQELLGAIKAARPESSPQSLTLARDPALAVTVSIRDARATSTSTRTPGPCSAVVRCGPPSSSSR